MPPSTGPARFSPPLLREWPVGVRVVLADLMPAAFGFLCGALLGSSGAVFLVLQLVGIAGGFAAGWVGSRTLARRF